ncbi:MAG TPA: cytochrome c [Solirubrobacteraceae bacterium]|nr:cytochrome c [Solirubrobacteraceae bacterium]
MPRRVRPRLLAPAVAAVALGTGACGEQGIQLAESDPNYEGAKIFQQSCSGCHSLEAAGTQGSASVPNEREYVDGPDFDTRVEDVDQVLYAIRNGGFSSGPMPQDIVVGEKADKVAEFLAKYSGKDAAE